MRRWKRSNINKQTRKAGHVTVTHIGIIIIKIKLLHKSHKKKIVYFFSCAFSFLFYTRNKSYKQEPRIGFTYKHYSRYPFDCV